MSDDPLLKEFECNRRIWESQGRAKIKTERISVEKHCPDRNFIVFGLSALAGREVWDSHDALAEVDEAKVRELSVEYHSNHRMLRKEMSFDGQQFAYLMEGGHWEVSRDDPFSQTLALLRRLPVFEASLGAIRYSTFKRSSSVRRSFESTNCKLSVLVVLFECNESAANESAPPITTVGSLRVGRRVLSLKRGDVVVVDTSYATTVALSEDSGDVVILEVDVWHPELLQPERQPVRDGIEQLFPASKVETPMIIVDSSSRTSHVAVDMFVDSPGSGGLYAGHPLAADYAKVQQELVSQRKRTHYSISVYVIGDRQCGKTSFMARLADPKRNPVAGDPSLYGDFCIAERGLFDPHVCPVTSQVGGPVKVKVRLRNDMPYEFPWVRHSPTEPLNVGIFLCFDISNRRSFEHLDAWLLKIQRTEARFPVKTAKVLLGLKHDHDPTVGSGSHRVGIFSALLRSLGYATDLQVVPSVDPLSSARRDLSREVAYDDALSFATLHGMPYVECSAKTGFATEDALATLLHHIFRSDPRLGATLPPISPSNEHFNSQSICVLT